MFFIVELDKDSIKQFCSLPPILEKLSSSRKSRSLLLVSALVNSRCFRIGSMEALSWPGRWAGQMCTLYPLSPVSKLWPFFLSVLKLSSLLFLTLSTPILVSQCHLETFLYTVSIQRGRKLEGYLFSDLFKGQGLEDSKSKNKHVLFSYLLYLTLSLVISKAGRSNMGRGIQELVTEISLGTLWSKTSSLPSSEFDFAHLPNKMIFCS